MLTLRHRIGHAGFGLVEVFMGFAFLGLVSLALVSTFEMGNRAQKAAADKQDALQIGSVLAQALSTPDICLNTFDPAAHTSGGEDPITNFPNMSYTSAESGAGTSKTFRIPSLRLPNGSSGYSNFIVTPSNSGTTPTTSEAVKGSTRLLGKDIFFRVFPGALGSTNTYNGEIEFVFQRQAANTNSISGAPTLSYRIPTTMTFDGTTGEFQGCATVGGGTGSGGVPTGGGTGGVGGSAWLVTCGNLSDGRVAPAGMTLAAYEGVKNYVFTCTNPIDVHDGKDTNPSPTPGEVVLPPSVDPKSEKRGFFSIYYYRKFDTYTGGDFLPPTQDPNCSIVFNTTKNRNEKICINPNPTPSGGIPTEDCAWKNPITNDCTCPKDSVPMLFFNFNNWECYSTFYIRPEVKSTVKPAGWTNPKYPLGCGIATFSCMPPTAPPYVDTSWP